LQIGCRWFQGHVVDHPDRVKQLKSALQSYSDRAETWDKFAILFLKYSPRPVARK